MTFLPHHPNSILKVTALFFLGLTLLSANAQEARQRRKLTASTSANMDRSVKPGDNFWLYCNGDWIKRTEIPPDRARIGVFSMLDDLSNKRTAALIEEIAKSNAPAGSGKRKIADLYNSYMDEAAIDGQGARRRCSLT